MAKYEVYEEFKASIMINGASNYYYKRLKEDLENYYTKGIDKYTTQMEETVRLPDN